MKFLSLFLVLTLLLCGCAPTRPDTTDPGETTLPTTAPTQPTESLPPEPEPTEPPAPVYHNPLTGEEIDAPTLNRPYCVMFNNIKAAMPQHGVAQADVLYELLVEGGITRCMGVYYDLSKATAPLGSIRSARKDYVMLAQGYDAIYVHAGMSSDDDYGAQQYLQSTGWDHIDGVDGSYAEQYFYRDQDRINEGYAGYHCLFITPSQVIAYATRMKCTLTRSESADYGYRFDDTSVTVGESAGSFTVYFGRNNYNKSTAFAYDPETRLYAASQYGTDYIDGNTGNALQFRNVIVLRTNIRKDSNTDLMKVDTVGSGTGYLACNGMVVPILWSRASADVPYTFTLENGNPVTFGVGKTYIGLTYGDAPVVWQ